MKKAFIITSSIEVSNSHPLTYSPVRSFFSAEDRLRQTIMTIASLDSLSGNETTIYLLDSSENWQAYRGAFAYQPNLKFISVLNEFPNIHQAVTTHPNKSYCECLMLETFIKSYQSELLQYDYIFKMSGRYFLDHSFDISICNAENTNKIFYKTPLSFKWNDDWGYELVDARAVQNNNHLHQYCSIIYGWGKQHTASISAMLAGIVTVLSNPKYHHYDIETLSYHVTRPFADDIIEFDWITYGWRGTDGQFTRY